MGLGGVTVWRGRGGGNVRSGGGGGLNAAMLWSWEGNGSGGGQTDRGENDGREECPEKEKLVDDRFTYLFTSC